MDYKFFNAIISNLSWKLSNINVRQLNQKQKDNGKTKEYVTPFSLEHIYSNNRHFVRVHNHHQRWIFFALRLVCRYCEIYH